MKKFRSIFVLLMILALVLVGCKTENQEKTTEKKENNEKTETEEEEKEVSDPVRKVIETMMTGPNEELLFVPSVIGEGVTQTEEEIQKILDENQMVTQRWQDKVGIYFEAGYLQAFLSEGPATKFLQEANAENQTLKVKKMTVESQSDYTEIVNVKYLLGDEEKETTLQFKKDSSGLLIEVTEDGEASEAVEHEAKRITRAEYIKAYMEEQNLPEEEAVVQLQEEHRALVRYGINVDDYDIVYEERTKEKDVGDGLIWVARIYTEVLVNKESGKYEALGIPVIRDVWLKGETEGIQKIHNMQSYADILENGNVQVWIIGGVYFLTDGEREFTKKDIEKTSKNSYQYIVDEEIIFSVGGK